MELELPLPFLLPVFCFHAPGSSGISNSFHCVLFKGGLHVLFGVQFPMASCVPQTAMQRQVASSFPVPTSQISSAELRDPAKGLLFPPTTKVSWQLKE